MIVPRFWAEGRVQHRDKGRQITVRRFGWSDAGEAEAQTMADARAQEALARLLAGEPLPRRDPKRAYNGAEGLPIREEIVEQRGPTVITRNSYGARCLNSPDVFFADIDFPSNFPSLWSLGILLTWAVGVGGTLFWLTHFAHWRLSAALVPVVGFTLTGRLALALLRPLARRRNDPERHARRALADFFARNPTWGARLYRTPAGLRLLVTHRTFQPDDPAVAASFQALGTDPQYARMCLRQRCFRARVSPKPWRAGFTEPLQTRRLVWPLPPGRLAGQQAWTARYEAAAAGFAACAFLETLGSGQIHPDVLPVQQWHDELCRAASGLPLA